MNMDDVAGEWEGKPMGDWEGNIMGDWDGKATGECDGNGDWDDIATGDCEGNAMGDWDGDATGDCEGIAMGDRDGDVIGDCDGNIMGDCEGNAMEDWDCIAMGECEGNAVGDTGGGCWVYMDIDDITWEWATGDCEGNVTGDCEGNVTGDWDDITMGDWDGDAMGDWDGTWEGTNDVGGSITISIINVTLSEDKVLFFGMVSITVTTNSSSIVSSSTSSSSLMTNIDVGSGVIDGAIDGAWIIRRADDNNDRTWRGGPGGGPPIFKGFVGSCPKTCGCWINIIFCVVNWFTTLEIDEKIGDRSKTGSNDVMTLVVKLVSTNNAPV
jgi:hypothetical protein